MRKLTGAMFASLDGVIQAPGGPSEDPTGGFKHGGWATSYFDETLFGTIGEWFTPPYALLLGRRTYDIFAAHWPYQKDSIADVFNATTKYVATHRPDTLTWQNTQWLGPDILATLRRLKQEDGPDLLIQGSGELIQALLAAGLIDEIRLLGVNIIRYDETTEDAEPGTVLRTQPLGGSTVRPGDTIEMWVAAAPETTTAPTTGSPSPTATPPSTASPPGCAPRPRTAAASGATWPYATGPSRSPPTTPTSSPRPPAKNCPRSASGPS